MTTLQRIRAMLSSERAALIASRLQIPGVRVEDGTWGAVGVCWKYSGGYREEFNPERDAMADWAVLVEVRKAWRGERWQNFVLTLQEIFAGRDTTPDGVTGVELAALAYVPGDYMDAALVVLLEEEGK